MTKHPVTDDHAAKFAVYLATWQEQLSLGDWRIGLSDVRSVRNVMAECYKFDLEQRSVVIRLGKSWTNTAVTDAELNKLALHECLHVFFHEVIIAAGEKLDSVPSLEHACINVLERLLADKP